MAATIEPDAQTPTAGLWRQSPERFIAALKEAGLARAAIVWDEDAKTLAVTHPVLAPIRAALLADKRDFDAHEACFFEIGASSGHLLSAVLHRTRRGQGAGGVRFWSYETLEGFVRDGLRLSRGMGHKNALAGLWWGGGKGVIARRPGVDHLDPEVRRAVYRDYGRFVTGLKGCYVTAEDVGTTPEDMRQVFATTRFTTSVPESLGGSGNPSRPTARGVVVAMEAALDYLELGDLAGKTVAMQGLGNVARFMIGELLARDVARIVGADIDPRSVEAARGTTADPRLEVRRVPAGDVSVFAEPCDVLAPNAVGEALNPDTIPLIRARIVCGAANNQLQDPARDAAALKERGILYVPDFLANRMGIVNCANEHCGTFPGDPAVEAHLDHANPAGVFQRCLEVCRRAEANGATPAAEAQALADELSLELNPLWGHRGAAIVRHLFESGWASERPGDESG